MFRKHTSMLLAVCLLVFAVPAAAAEVDSDAVYCFTNEDFETQEPLKGICITGLPDAEVGTLYLGVRVLRCGDILTADQLAQVTFCPIRTQADTDAVLTYLPIHEDYVAESASMVIAIRGKEDKAPVAEDLAAETYKNLPNEGKLKVTDPEGQTMTYTVIRQPRRGSVEIRSDGSFVYTPKKNKVGVDSFTYTAADPAGNVSREATVTVRILKPSDAAQYTDTVGLDCRFEAEWLRNTGLFVGEKIGGQECFQPDKTVSRGEFLTMVIRLLEIPVTEQTADTALTQQAPQWLKPYLAAAVRSGLLASWPEAETFEAEAPITGAEAAVLLQNALDLPVAAQTVQTDETAEEDVPTWADTALAVMRQQGFSLSYDEPLTRAQVAQMLYQLQTVAQDAPGMAVIRLNRQ